MGSTLAAGLAGGTGLLVAFLAAVGMGAIVGRAVPSRDVDPAHADEHRPWFVAAGLFTAVACAPITRLHGQTLSLSTVDVHTAFHVAIGPLWCC